VTTPIPTAVYRDDYGDDENVGVVCLNGCHTTGLASHCEDVLRQRDKSLFIVGKTMATNHLHNQSIIRCPATHFRCAWPVADALNLPHALIRYYPRSVTIVVGSDFKSRKMLATISDDELGVWTEKNNLHKGYRPIAVEVRDGCRNPLACQQIVDKCVRLGLDVRYSGMNDGDEFNPHNEKVKGISLYTVGFVGVTATGGSAKTDSDGRVLKKHSSVYVQCGDKADGLKVCDLLGIDSRRIEVANPTIEVIMGHDYEQFVGPITGAIKALADAIKG
jgi:hypothetical protein